MKKFLVGFLLLCSPAQFAFAHPTSLPDAINRSLSAVVFVANEYNSFDDYFDPFPDSYIECMRPLYEWLWPSFYSHGSGFLISENGYIMTCAHVVQGMTDTLIILSGDGSMRILDADVVGVDPSTDIAVLKIKTDEEEKFPYLTFGDSDQVKIGEPIAAIGNPLSPFLNSTVTCGIISGLERRGFEFQSVEEFFQIDASINSGNSGGPVINKNGEVIGIAVATLPTREGLNFAIPSHIAKKAANCLICLGKVPQSYLGIIFKDDSQVVFGIYKFDGNQGAIVKDVIDDSPAEEIGLRKGDIITAIDGHQIRSLKALMAYLAVTPPYHTVELTVKRGGETSVFSVELGAPPSL